MSSKTKILIIDGDNLCHRAYHKFRELTSHSGESTSTLYGFPYILQSLVHKFEPTSLFIVFDGGRSKHRLEILPTYKARDVSLDFDRESFYAQKKLIMEIVSNLGATVLWGQGFEADDLIYMLIKRVINLNSSYVTIVSSDKDFNQLLQPNLKIFNPFISDFITHLSLKTKLGYTPKAFIDYLILKGDSSDKIPGVMGLGDVRIKQFLTEFGSIESYLDKGETSLWARYNIREVYPINNLLINLPLFYLKFHKRLPHIPYFNQIPRVDIKAVQAIGRPRNITLFNKLDFLNTFKSLV